MCLYYNMYNDKLNQFKLLCLQIYQPPGLLQTTKIRLTVTTIINIVKFHLLKLQYFIKIHFRNRHTVAQFLAPKFNLKTHENASIQSKSIFNVLEKSCKELSNVCSITDCIVLIQIVQIKRHDRLKNGIIKRY